MKINVIIVFLFVVSKISAQEADTLKIRSLENLKLNMKVDSLLPRIDIDSRNQFRSLPYNERTNTYSSKYNEDYFFNMNLTIAASLVVIAVQIYRLFNQYIYSLQELNKTVTLHPEQTGILKFISLTIKMPQPRRRFLSATIPCTLILCTNRALKLKNISLR